MKLKSKRWCRKTTTAIAPVFVMIVFVSLTACIHISETRGSENPAVNEQLRIENKWGIHIQDIRLSAAGYMLDFRYQVLDSEKADSLFIRRVKPYLINQRTGLKYGVLSSAKTGPLRPINKPIADRTYVMIFSNPAQSIKAGDEVTVVIGEFRAENLIVK